MKKLILSLLLFCSLSFAIDPFILIGISSDKSSHAAFNYALTDIVEDDWGQDMWVSFVCVTSVGILKETIDKLLGGEFDTNDLLANYVGWGAYRLVKWEMKFDL